MKLITTVLLVLVLGTLANCKKFEDENQLFPPSFSAGKSYKNSKNQFIIEQPMLWELPVLAQNAKLTAAHICEILGKRFINVQDAIVISHLNKSVRGVYMGHDSFGQMTGLEYGTQKEVIEKMYCLEKATPQ